MTLQQQIEELKKRNTHLENQIEEYALNRKDAKKDYKDRLFKFIFGNLENRKWTLSLYNAVNGTDYSNPDL